MTLPFKDEHVNTEKEETAGSAVCDTFTMETEKSSPSKIIVKPLSKTEEVNQRIIKVMEIYSPYMTRKQFLKETGLTGGELRTITRRRPLRFTHEKTITMEKKVLKAYTPGITKAELHRKTNVSPENINRVAKKYDLTFSAKTPRAETAVIVKKLLDEGLTRRQIASKLGCSLPRVNNVIFFHLPEYKKQSIKVNWKLEIEKMKPLVQSGWTIEQIAKKLDIYERTVRNIMRKHYPEYYPWKRAKPKQKQNK